MSIQLVVYPQNYLGYTAYNNPAMNLLQDGSAFNTIPNALTESITPPQLPYFALNNSPANTNWKSFGITGSTAPAKAFNNTYLQNEVRFFGTNLAPNVATTGIYQKVTNLVIGQTYDIILDVTKAMTIGSGNQESLFVGIVGANFVNPPSVMPNPSVVLTGTDTVGTKGPVSFTATSNEHVICLTYTSALTGVNDYLGISNIRVNAAISNLAYNDGQVIVDLYNEQEIPLTLSADTFTNAGEKQQSYSKSFNLPATKHNNKLFEFIFDFTRQSTSLPLFNPYKQTRATYKQNGITIFKGFLRLINIQEKKGERSYNVNLYSESTSLADILKTRKFSDLTNTLNELTHKYNRDRIQQSWSGGINLEVPLSNPNEFAGAVGATSTDVLRYPFCDWTGNIKAVASQNDVDNGAEEGMPALNQLEDAFRPWIQILYLWNNIFADAGFTYTSQFIPATFNDLYMDFNWGGDTHPTNAMSNGQALYLSSDAAINFPDGVGVGLKWPSQDSFPSNVGYDASTGVFTATGDYVKYNLEYDLFMDIPTGTIVFGHFMINWTQFGLAQPPANEQIVQITPGDIITFNGVFERTLMTGDTIQFRFKVFGTGSPSGHFEAVSRISGGASQGNITSGSMLNTLRGELNQWEWIKGLMTMFNLVILQDKSNPQNLIIEPYQYIFIEDLVGLTPKTLDWTEKVDTDDLKLEPIKLKQTTLFAYDEDKDYPYNVYKNATGGYQYGSLKYTVPEYTLVTGDEKVIAKPFAATVMKPVFDFTPNFIAPAIYSADEEGTKFQGFDNKPRILFNVSGNTPYTISGGAPGLTYFIKYQNGTSGTNQNSYGLFSHTDAIPSTANNDDFNFGPCQFIGGVGVPPVANLFSRYYQDYYDQLYNPDTRKLKLKLLLNENDVSSFEFYDKIMIKNRLFRVDKINYKPDGLSTVELILLP